MLEYCKDPVGCKVTSPTFFANFGIERDWIGLKSNRGLPARSIIATAFSGLIVGSRSGSGCRTEIAVGKQWKSGVSM